MATTRDAIERHLAAAEHFARVEMLTALQQPGLRLITALKNRSEALDREQREEALLEAQVAELFQYEEIDL